MHGILLYKLGLCVWFLSLSIIFSRFIYIATGLSAHSVLRPNDIPLLRPIIAGIFGRDGGVECVDRFGEYCHLNTMVSPNLQSQENISFYLFFFNFSQRVLLCLE